MLNVKIEKRFSKSSAKLPDNNNHNQASDSVEFTLDVEFTVPSGVTILFGPSGSGKSLTLRSIAGLFQPDRGRITIDETVLFDREREINLPIRARRTGYVFQHLALFPHLSALGNVEFAMMDLERDERRTRALNLLQTFRISHIAERRPRNISGGEAQRVALARALAARPRILLLDEPMSALDEETKLGIIADLKKINDKLRLPVVYVTHSREEALMMGERIIVYERGRIVARGKPLEVFGKLKVTSKEVNGEW